jgi:hypothetical protein
MIDWQGIVDRVRTVFAEHKIEMLIAAGVGFFVGSVLF